MTGTVDLVIAGDGGAAVRAAALSALQTGQCVLVVLRGDARTARRLRTTLLRAAGRAGGQLRVMARAEVVCVDGVNGVEAVVVRHSPTGRLSAVNASAFFSCGVQSDE